MKKSNFLIFCFFLMVSFLNTHQLAAQSCSAPTSTFEKSSLVGNWEGSYTQKGATHPLKANITLNGDVLTVSMSLPDLNITNQVFTSRVCGSSALSLSSSLPGDKSITLTGRPNNDVLSGSFNISIGCTCATAGDTFSMQKTNAAQF